MPLPLPDLDDRRWSDLVDEARSMIHRLSPGWTDHNFSDPGITLLDLFAWITEADVFGVDRIPRQHRAQFLSLIGIRLHDTVPARTPVQFVSRLGALSLPEGVVLSAVTDGGTAVPHRLSHPIDVVGCALIAVQTWDGSAYRDETENWRHGGYVAVLGNDPAPGAASLLGLDAAPAVAASAELSMWITVDESALSAPDHGSPREHHSARITWEYHDGVNWQPFSHVIDDTRSLTESGRVVLPIGEAGAVSSVIGTIIAPRRWLRARLSAGRHDVAPVAREILIDAVPVLQSVPEYATWVLPDPVAPPPAFLLVGDEVSMRLSTDALGRILTIDPPASGDRNLPRALVLDAASGHVTLTLVPAGICDGVPLFETTLDGAPLTGHASIWTCDTTGSTPWTIVETLRRSGPGDRHVEFDMQSGRIAFGDGEHGQVPTANSLVVVRANTTQGTGGTPTGRTVWRLDTASPLTRAPMPPVDGSKVGVRAATPIVAREADDLETGEGYAADRVWTHERLIEIAPQITEPTLDQLGRALVMTRSRPERAATLLDFERLAIDVPGTGVIRARAWAGLDPVNPCRSAPGTVTVVVVPGLPADMPVPTPALLREVRKYLCPRRTIGTRLVVAGPAYVEVTVRAVITARRGVDTARVEADAHARLFDFLHPLTGGPLRRGWPFGRDVYEAEVLRELDLVDGVDHIEQIELVTGDVVVDCGNVCVGPTSLVVSGAHEVSVR
jgi:hypothetical protein